ncbi:MAG: hypothetical protein KAI24_15865 [Planctomycetes bacterium]|nr:hypothetical protein [Planctomycetota bacterium]
MLLAATATSQVNWTLAQGANAPPPFSGSCWDSNRGVLVAYGGNVSGVPVSTMREWDGAAWANLSPSPRPSPRGRPALAFDEARNETVLFGGLPVSQPETWTWNGSSWTQESPANQPSVRFGAAAAYDPLRQVVVLFGGFVPSGVDTNETWEWDGNNWTQRTPAGAVPTARGAHRMVWDASRGACVVVGGFSTPQNNTLSDVWSWDGNSWTAEPSLPGTMCDQAMCYDPTRQRIIVHSGLRITNGVFSDLSDTLELDNTWTVRATAQAPMDRNSAASAWDPVRGVFVSGGGSTSTGTLLTDTWTYSPVSPATMTAFGFGCVVTNGARLEERSLPYIGLPFEQAIVDASPAAAVGLVVFGGSNTTWGGTPLPLDLNSIGAPSCSLLVSLDVAVTVLLSNGAGSTTWNLPNLPAAVGSMFYTQGVVLDPTSPLPFQIDATSGRAFTIGNP